MKTIILFDMDGVLLHAGGYQRALQETVSLIAKAIGFPQVSLSREDIHYFEAMGVTSEWDSAAICTALLLRQAWQKSPDLPLPENPLIQVLPNQQGRPPDFRVFFQELEQAVERSQSPLAAAEQALFRPDRNGYTAGQAQTLHTLLRNARGIEGSLTHRLFQEMILGSQVFEEVYRRHPYLDVRSYLAAYDAPALTRLEQVSLRGWFNQPGHSGAIFTNRPSRAPEGFFSTPEAEIGAQTAGVEGLPILGFGSLAWFAAREGKDLQTYLKPSPVHVLAALWLSAHQEEWPKDFESLLPKALSQANQLVNGRAGGEWSFLQEAHVLVFEDAIRGMLGALAAEGILDQLGIPVEFHLVGISDNFLKQQSLARVGAKVYPNLPEALAALGILSRSYQKSKKPS